MLFVTVLPGPVHLHRAQRFIINIPPTDYVIERRARRVSIVVVAAFGEERSGTGI